MTSKKAFKILDIFPFFCPKKAFFLPIQKKSGHNFQQKELQVF